MGKKNIVLITAILASIVFIGFLGETEAKSLFGYELSIWVYRIAWLFIATTFFIRYFRLRKSEN